MNIPTYRDELAKAQALRKQGSPEQLQQARQLIEEARRLYPFALPLGDELALVLQLQGHDGEAVSLLKDLTRQFQDAGEETLCRFGKVYKRLADRQMASGNHAAAVANLLDSEREYGRAFEKSKGYYPRINQFTVRFVRAGVLKTLGKPDDATQLLQQVRDEVRAMLADPNVWQARKSDDNVWISATQGEANVLLANWPAAERAYTEAIRHAAGKKFYHDCMRDQLRQLLIPAFAALNIPFDSQLAEPDAFFQLPKEISS